MFKVVKPMLQVREMPIKTKLTNLEQQGFSDQQITKSKINKNSSEVGIEKDAPVIDSREASLSFIK